MPIVSLIITPDKIRRSPTYQQHTVDEHVTSQRAEMSRAHLSQVIEGVYKLAQEMCGRKDDTTHNCVQIGTCSYDNGESVHVSVTYVLECLFDSLHQEHFIEAVKNRMNHGRAASYPSFTPPDITKC